MLLNIPFVQRRTAIVCALVLGLCAGANIACTTTNTTAEPAIVETPPPAQESEETPDPVAAACDAETTLLKEKLDKAHEAKTDAVLAVKTPSCGLRVLTSGPSKLAGTELHRIGSVTKTYVAAVVVDLAKSGALGLDDAVGQWVADVPGGKEITIRQLLQHTSGLFNYNEDAAFGKTAFTQNRSWSPRELLDVAFAHRPYFEPGKGWHYSNTNYILLGLVAETAGNAKIGPLVRSRILEKIGARATFFDGEEPVKGELATGRDALGVDVTRVVGPSWAWAAGAMVATPADLALWIEQLSGGSFYDETQKAEVFRGVATESSAVRYGLGLMILDARATGGAGPGYGHDGETIGYHTAAFYFPETKTTIVSIVDSDAGSATDISMAALGVLFPSN